jgi:hypothetical protein
VRSVKGLEKMGAATIKLDMTASLHTFKETAKEAESIYGHMIFLLTMTGVLDGSVEEIRSYTIQTQVCLASSYLTQYA